MGYNLEFLPEAEIDLDEIAEWYAQMNARLVNDFLNKLDEALLTVQNNPQHFQKVYKTYRKLNLSRFPFKVIYRIEKQTLVIIAIVHHKRNARYWKGRE